VRRIYSIFRSDAGVTPVPSVKISLIIPAYNEEQYIGACLDSILEHAPGRFCEIIVIDNASMDHTAEIARQRPGVRVVHEPHKGLPHARQRGLEEASGELIAFIDADTRVPKYWIDIVEDVFVHRPDVVCLSGCYRYYDSSLLKRVLLTALWWSAAPLTYRVVGYMVTGGNFVARKSALQAINGFNRTIDFYGEDTDVARRLSKYGTVLFRMDFFIYTSVRRFEVEGLFKTSATYAINYVWPVLFHRPYSIGYSDVRTVPKSMTCFNRTCRSTRLLRYRRRFTLPRQLRRR
jgi:glycosyltransferase involved in cell wall biosynthesis